MGLYLLAFAGITQAASSTDRAFSEAPSSQHEAPAEGHDNSRSPFSDSDESDSEPEPEDGEDDDRDDCNEHVAIHLVTAYDAQHAGRSPRAPAAIASSDHPLAEPPTPPPRA